MLTPWNKSYEKPRQHFKKQRHHFADKGPSSQSYGFSSSRIWMWKLDNKEGWALKNWCFRTVVLEKTLESPLDSKEIKPVNPKGNQPWVFIRKTDAEAEALIPQPSDAMSRLIGKDPTHWKRPWCWERLKARGEGVDKGPDGWMASPTQWTGVRANFETWWRTGKPRLLWSMGSQTDTTERLNNNRFYFLGVQNHCR